MIPTSDNYFSRVSTTSQKCHMEISLKTLNTFASTVNNCEVIMNTYYNQFLEGICLNTMKCHWTSLKRLSVLLYQHWLNTMSWLNFFSKILHAADKLLALALNVWNGNITVYITISLLFLTNALLKLTV